MSSAYEARKRALDPLELEIQAVLSSLVHTGIKPGFSGGAASGLNSSSPSSPIFFLNFIVEE